jgi:hypothetical protein
VEVMPGGRTARGRRARAGPEVQLQHATQRALAARSSITRRTAVGSGGQRATQTTGEAEAQGQSD